MILLALAFSLLFLAPIDNLHFYARQQSQMIPWRDLEAPRTMKKGVLLHRIYSIVLVLVSDDHQMIEKLAELQNLAERGFRYYFSQNSL